MTDKDSAITPPDPQESLDDLEREQQERQGTQLPPWKTLPYWLSALATIIGFILGLELPDGSLVMQIIAPVATVLWYLGYSVKSPRDYTGVGRPPSYRTRRYWTDIGSTTIGFLLGSGLAATDTVMQIAGGVAALSAQFGIETIVWVKKKRMINPLNLEEGNVEDIIERVQEGAPDLPEPGEDKYIPTAGDLFHPDN